MQTNTFQKQMVLCFPWWNRHCKTIIHSFRPDLKTDITKSSESHLVIIQLSWLFGFPRLVQNQQDVIYVFQLQFCLWSPKTYCLYSTSEWKVPSGWQWGTVLGCPPTCWGQDVPWLPLPLLGSLLADLTCQLPLKLGQEEQLLHLHRTDLPTREQGAEEDGEGQRQGWFFLFCYLNILTAQLKFVLYHVKYASIKLGRKLVLRLIRP